jgi:transcription termination/antitermination protein NusG
MAKAWFAIRCQSEREESIARSLEARIKKNGIENQISRLVVPTEFVSEIKDGARKVSKMKMFPGYIFAEIELNADSLVTEDSWFTVMDTPGVSGFVSQDRLRPEPMEPDEVERILENMKEREEKPRPKVLFEVGQKVRIKEGSFENYEAEIEDVLHEKGILKLKVSIFGRHTSLELEFGKVEII